ncbi:MAG: DUF1439 domain-containing protein [Lysobacter sp.]|nr:DUF1439 domain-containing protein [Lysobacter sp.]
MHRRHLLQGTALLLAALLCGCAGLATGLFGNQLVFTAPQLQGYLDKRFPRDYDKLGGLVTLTVLHPRLSIPQDGDRLRLDFDVGVGTLGHASRAPSGHIAIASGLRFDPQTRGLHLDAPTLEQADVPALGGALGGSGRELVNRWLADYARDEPVYRFDQGLWQRLEARRIGATTIEHGQVVVHLD